MQREPWRMVLVGVVLATATCSDNPTGPPLEVELGETTFVVFVNPIVNTGNGVTLPTPGTARSGISVTPDGGTGVVTDADGVSVLSPVNPGARTLTLQGGGLSATTVRSIADHDLHEVAIALTASGAAVMTDVRYAFGGEVVEITPNTPAAQVNQQLARSNIIVFLRGGTYTGDLAFAGSAVTLFGEGGHGGRVTIQGNVTIAGSSNRIRGARITGNLTVPGSNVGISFSRVDGSFVLTGSSAILLKNAFCGAVTLAGSNPTLLGNAGLAPIPASSGC